MIQGAGKRDDLKNNQNQSDWHQGAHALGHRPKLDAPSAPRADRWRWRLLEKVIEHCQHAGKSEPYLFTMANRAGSRLLEYGRFLTPLHRGQRHQDAHHDDGQIGSINPRRQDVRRLGALLLASCRQSRSRLRWPARLGRASYRI